MSTQTIDFPGSTGDRLEGVLHVPDAPHGSVLLAHCFTCSKDLHTMTRLASGLADAGYAVLRFDFTGLGDSAGDFGATTLAHDVRDLAAAATELISRGYGPCGLVGHSFGGAAALLAAERLHTVRSIAVLGAPASPTHLRHLFVDAEPLDEGRVGVRIANRTFQVRQAFLDDLESHDQQNAIADLERPLMVVHAVDDEVVDVTEGERIFAAARQPKGFVPLLDADHLLSDRRSAEQALRVIVTWFDTTLS